MNNGAPSFRYIKDLINYKKSNSLNAVATEALELDMEIPLEKTKPLIKELIDFLIIKEFIKLDFRDYDNLIMSISKGMIEILLLNTNKKKPLDVSYVLTELIIEKLELDTILDKTNLIFIFKELHSIVISMFSQFGIIVKSIKDENIVLITMYRRKGNFLIIPKKWFLITLPVIYSLDNTEFETLKLKIDLIWET